MTSRMRPQLRREVERVLQIIGAASHNLNDRRGTKKAARTDAVYETYVFSLIIEAIQGMPGPSSGPMPQTAPGGKFKFRRAPGKLHTTPSKFSYVECDVRGKRYELHVDTYVSTKAPGAELEMDVVIVEGTAADSCRGSRTRNPKHMEMRLAIEVKYLSGKYGTGLAKELLGIWNQVGGRDGLVALVTNCPLTNNAERLLKHRKVPRYSAVLPTRRNQAQVDGFVREMRAALTQALR